MTKALELINGPGDDYRGPNIGAGTEHGDSYRTAVEKMNAAIEAVNEMRGADASGNATSIPESNTQGNADISARLEQVEIAVARIIDWIDGTPGQPPAAEPPTEPYPGPYGADKDGQPFTEPQVSESSGFVMGGATQMPDAVITDGQPEDRENYTQEPDGTYHPITPTPDASGVELTGADGRSNPEPLMSQPEPIATFGGQPGIPVGNTKGEGSEDNRFVASGASGRVEAEQPTDQVQQPGADPDSKLVYPGTTDEPTANIGGAPVIETTDSAPSPVELQPEEGAGSVNPGIAALADAERRIEAKQERDDAEVNSPADDPFDAVDNPATPPSQETIERADATAANNDRKGG